MYISFRFFRDTSTTTLRFLIGRSHDNSTVTLTNLLLLHPSLPAAEFQILLSFRRGAVLLHSLLFSARSSGSVSLELKVTIIYTRTTKWGNLSSPLFSSLASERTNDDAPRSDVVMLMNPSPSLLFASQVDTECRAFLSLSLSLFAYLT